MAKTHDRRLFASPSAHVRTAAARAFLGAEAQAAELVVVGATYEVALEVTRELGATVPATFGWHRCTLAKLAGALAGPTLATAGRVNVGALAREAVCARLVHARRAGEQLGRLAPIAETPGLPRALARTFEELRLGRVDAGSLEDTELATLLRAYDDELVKLGLSDRADLFGHAIAVARSGARHELLDKPLLVLDAAIVSALERDLVEAIVARAPRVLVTVPSGDERTLAMLRGLPLHAEPTPQPRTPIETLHARLFADDTSGESVLEAVTILSAPGESRECVEIARRIVQEADRGTPFDRMAILLRSPERYRAHLEEALRRARVPAYFARGTVRPHPAGRAMLSLLACAAEGLRATRFAEYLSLGVVPDADEGGAPPQALSGADRHTVPDDEVVPDAIARAGAPRVDSDEEPTADPDARPVIGGTLRAPRLWERLLVDAAVIGTGVDRWRRRLAGLRRALELDAAHDDATGGVQSARLERDLAGLAALQAFALPLLEDLASLPREASWGVWLDRLGALATRALRNPDNVLATLAELQPMASVGPVSLREVRLVLERRLGEVTVPPSARRYGRVYIASTSEARGLSFDVVFVPGLTEKMFPQKVVEDPILPDRPREALDGALRTRLDRTNDERLALRVALGAASRRAVVSYSRLDVDQSRPRTPSFYGLEVLKAAEGELGGFEELARRAAGAGGARIGWPAPDKPDDAIDEAEHDLALLESIDRRPESETVGMARYLLTANDHLKRALRSRWMRFTSRQWTAADGLVDPAALAKEALAKHSLAARSFSPTALQNYAACPYRFLLQAIHRLSPREEPTVLEELDPLQRGSLVHEVEFELHCALREAGLLPVTERNFARAREALDATLARVAKKYEDSLCPAIERVWVDAVTAIGADLREALRRSAEHPEWKPVHFELSFGLKDRRDEDPNSTHDPVLLDCGIKLRGSIDLVERHDDGSLRATDYKTGKVRAEKNRTVIGGGETLQPVFYALVLEKLFPKARIEGGRLWYCTSAGDFEDVSVPLDDEARASGQAVATAVGDALTEGFLPAAPNDGACTYCDYQAVCGPYAQSNAQRKGKDKKSQARTKGLVLLRGKR